MFNIELGGSGNIETRLQWQCRDAPETSWHCVSCRWNLAGGTLPRPTCGVQTAFCFPFETSLHAAQGVDHDASARWMAAGVEGTATTSGEVAQGKQASPQPGQVSPRTCTPMTNGRSVSKGPQSGGGVVGVGAQRLCREHRGRVPLWKRAEVREPRDTCGFRAPKSPPLERGYPDWRGLWQRWEISKAQRWRLCAQL